MLAVQILWAAHGHALWKEGAFTALQTVQSTAGNGCDSRLLGNRNTGSGINRGNRRGCRLHCRAWKTLRFEREEPPRSSAGGISRDGALRADAADETTGWIEDHSWSEGLWHYGSETVWRALLYDFLEDRGAPPDANCEVSRRPRHLYVGRQLLRHESFRTSRCRTEGRRSPHRASSLQHG